MNLLVDLFDNQKNQMFLPSMSCCLCSYIETELASNVQKRSAALTTSGFAHRHFARKEGGNGVQGTSVNR